MDVIKDIINNIYNNYKLSNVVLLALLMCSLDNDLKSMLDPLIFNDERVYPILMGLTALVYLITWLLFCWWFFLHVSDIIISISRKHNIDMTIYDKSIVCFDLKPYKKVTRYRLVNAIKMLCFLVMIVSFHKHYQYIVHYLLSHFGEYQLLFLIFPSVLVIYLFVFKIFIKNKIWLCFS